MCLIGLGAPVFGVEPTIQGENGLTQRFTLLDH